MMQYAIGFGVLWFVGKKLNDIANWRSYKKTDGTKMPKPGPNFLLDKYQQDDFAADLMLVDEAEWPRAMKMHLGDPSYYRGLWINEEPDDILNQVPTVGPRYITPAFHNFT